MRLMSVVGARPNFVKLAALTRALAGRSDVEHVVVHTGQHYDPQMSDAFFAELDVARPDFCLEVGSGSHAAQTAAVIQRLEPVCLSRRPEAVLVYGDVNSTMAAALVAVKLGIPVAHVEAGLRSRDWSMPEEINRVVTDRISTWLFAPSRDALDNLREEGIADGRVCFAGNIMIDTLCWALPEAQRRNPATRYGVGGSRFTIVTLHRPGNVDDPEILRELLKVLAELGEAGTVLFPVHPRTEARISDAGWEPPRGAGLRLLEPLGYLDMLGLVDAAALVITDSGGLQEETTYLGVPCITVRPNTERPVTCLHGTNRLVPPRRDVLLAAARRAITRRTPARPVIERWDGRAAERMVSVLCEEASTEELRFETVTSGGGGYAQS